MRYLERRIALVALARKHDRVGELVGEQRREAGQCDHHQTDADPLEDRAPREHVYGQAAKKTDEAEHECGEVAVRKPRARTSAGG